MQRTSNRHLLNKPTVWTCEMRITMPVISDPDERWLTELLETAAPEIMWGYYDRTPLFRLIPESLALSTQTWHRRLAFPQVYFHLYSIAKATGEEVSLDHKPEDITEDKARLIVESINELLAVAESTGCIPYHCDVEGGLPHIGPATYKFIMEFVTRHGLMCSVNGDYQEWTPGKGGTGFITYRPVERWAIKYNPCRGGRKK